MAWSTIDAVGSNARPGSDVLIVNELSTTSVGAAVRAVEPAATTTDAVTTAAASDASSAPRLLRSLVTGLAPSGRVLGLRRYSTSTPATSLCRSAANRPR